MIGWGVSRIWNQTSEVLILECLHGLINILCINGLVESGSPMGGPFFDPKKEKVQVLKVLGQ